MEQLGTARAYSNGRSNFAHFAEARRDAERHWRKTPRDYGDDRVDPIDEYDDPKTPLYTHSEVVALLAKYGSRRNHLVYRAILKGISGARRRSDGSTRSLAEIGASAFLWSGVIFTLCYAFAIVHMIIWSGVGKLMGI